MKWVYFLVLLIPFIAQAELTPFSSIEAPVARSLERYVMTQIKSGVLTSDIRFFVESKADGKIKATAVACLESAGLGQRGAYYLCNAILGEVQPNHWVVLPSGAPYNGYSSCSALKPSEFKNLGYTKLLECPTAD